MMRILLVLLLAAGAVALVRNGPEASRTGAEAKYRAEERTDQEAVEAEIRQADDSERRAMLGGDTEAQARIWADDFMVTSAAGDVLTKRDVMAVFERGIIPYTTFERTADHIRLYGDVAISLGSEIVVSAGDPEARRVPRRYTHVWVKRDGRWRLAVRQGMEVPSP